MSVILMNELNTHFTNIVASYIRKGYTFSTTTMGGSHSNEICHVDLANKKGFIIRVWMLRKLGNIFKHKLDTVTISVRKYDTDFMWYDDGVELESFTVYEIDREKGCYVPTLERAQEICQIRTNRLKSRDYRNTNTIDKYKLSPSI